MSKQELVNTLFRKLHSIYEMIGEAEEDIDVVRDYADGMAKTLKEFFEETGQDYTEALDQVLSYSEGKSYKSIVMTFGVTPEERKRVQRVKEHQAKEKQRWEAYVKKCEEEGISPYITTKPYVPPSPPRPGDWTTSWGNGAPQTDDR